MKDDELPPLELDISWEDPSPEAALTIGVLESADDVDMAIDQEQGGVVLLFPESKHGIMFRGAAMQKVLFLFDTLIHNVIDSHSAAGASGEGPRQKKKVTLH